MGAVHEAPDLDHVKSRSSKPAVVTGHKAAGRRRRKMLSATHTNGSNMEKKEALSLHQHCKGDWPQATMATVVLGCTRGSTGPERAMTSLPTRMAPA